MRLTTFSDYAFRVMLFAVAKKGQQFTIDEANAGLMISRAHLTKVVNALTKAGYLIAQRGRNGGLRLARPASQVGLGELLRTTEHDFNLVECMRQDCHCSLRSGCTLPPVLRKATKAFISVLDEYTLADFALEPEMFVTNPTILQKEVQL